MWNDKETDLDLLDHEKIAQTILEIINDGNLRPLTIGVYGDWGVGKSSVLSLLQNEIETQRTRSGLNVHTILFNGWLFQGYEDAKSALMETIVTDLAKLQPAHKKIQELAKSLLRRVNWLKVAKMSANVAMTAIAGLPAGSILSGLGSIIKHSKSFLVEKEKLDVNTIEVKEEEGFLKEAEEETVTGQIHCFRKEFKELILTSKVDHVIILVDDLDRCLPKAVIEVLEAIRLFLFVEGTTFIISADERMIEYAVREHFPGLPASYSDYTKSYLEKLVQVPIRIPYLNQLQTGNYIKFLLLQQHLQNNLIELKRIYQHFIQKRTTPYDNLPLTYEITKEAMGTDSLELQQALLVGDQLGPTLTLGLNGNPRNVKRFLNTLFLRQRISKIYGLQQVVKLDVLAKLMLLERFQQEEFELVVKESLASDSGLSKKVSDGESVLREPAVSENEDQNISPVELSKSPFYEWCALHPPLTGVDLRPYIFISKEKAIGLQSQQDLPTHLAAMLDQLNSGSEMALNNASKHLTSLSSAEASRLFEILETESRSVTELSSAPKAIKGLLRIVKSHPEFEERIVQLFDAYPVTTLGVWPATQLDSFATEKGKTALAKLRKKWSEQSENRQLKNIVSVTLNNNR